MDYIRESERVSKEEAIKFIDTRIEWWGIIAGNHVLTSLIELSHEDPEWAHFKGPVIVISGTHDMETLGQIALVNNSI